MNAYHAFALVYDRMMEEIPYEEWCNFVTDQLKKFGIEDISMLTEKHCIEVGHIFQLGQRYSLSMNATFRNAENQSDMERSSG